MSNEYYRRNVAAATLSKYIQKLFHIQISARNHTYTYRQTCLHIHKMHKYTCHCSFI